MFHFPCAFVCMLLAALVAIGVTAADDVTTLLSISHSAKFKAIKQRKQEAKASPVVKAFPKVVGETQLESSVQRRFQKGVIFIKMIKVGGEAFSDTLSQFAFKHGWRALTHKNCSEEANPNGLATCGCGDYHFIGSDEVPPIPPKDKPYDILFTHMHYDPVALGKFFNPGAVKLVIFRHPLSVLQSIHKMAAIQAIHKPWINDSFCQPFALKPEVWRENCPAMRNGRDSILDYMNHSANEALLQLFENKPDDLHDQAMAIVNDVAKQLESEFVVGLQEDYDASMLLFEHALGWDRQDTLYWKDDPGAHQFKDNRWTRGRKDAWNLITMVADSWQGNNSKAIIAKLEEGPYYYYRILYDRAVELHRKQVREALGDKAQVQVAMDTYQAQNKEFTKCINRDWESSNANPCTLRGLHLHTNIRPECARKAQL